MWREERRGEGRGGRGGERRGEGGDGKWWWWRRRRRCGGAVVRCCGGVVLTVVWCCYSPRGPVAPIATTFLGTVYEQIRWWGGGTGFMAGWSVGWGGGVGGEVMGWPAHLQKLRRCEARAWTQQGQETKREGAEGGDRGPRHGGRLIGGHVMQVCVLFLPCKVIILGFPPGPKSENRHCQLRRLAVTLAVTAAARTPTNRMPKESKKRARTAAPVR